MSVNVAALFVVTGGCYFGLPDVDPWDITRDARKYRDPDTVPGSSTLNRQNGEIGQP